MTALYVLLGAIVGAPSRYLLDLLVQSAHETRMPWGTVSVNAVGCLVLGATAGGVDAGGGPAWLLTLLGTGFCGALTTFSTFSFETVRLLEEGALFEAFSNVAVSLVVGLLACFGGFALTAALLAA